MNNEDQQRKQEVLKFTEKLRSAGIAKVSVSYSGCGDEGRCEEPQLQDRQAQPIDRWSLPIEIDLEPLGDLLEGFAPEGYEDNDGGFGTVSFDVESQKLRVEHNWYETINHQDEPWEI